MKFKRVLAVIERNLISRNIFNRIITIFYWTVLNIVIWGSTSAWISSGLNSNKFYTSNILICVGLWQIVFRVNLETAKSLLEDINSKNLLNLFSSPLTFFEWAMAMIFLGLIETILTFSVTSLALFFTYCINIFALGFNLILYIFLLYIFGISIGFIVCSFLLIYSNKVQDLVYSFGYIFAPFSAIYYPIMFIKPIPRLISEILPTSYIFESIRNYYINNYFDYISIYKSCILNLIYVIFSIIFLNYAFKRVKVNGLLNL